MAPSTDNSRWVDGALDGTGECKPDRGLGRGAVRGAGCGIDNGWASVGQYFKSRAASTDGDDGTIISITPHNYFDSTNMESSHVFPVSTRAYLIKVFKSHFYWRQSNHECVDCSGFATHDRRQEVKRRGWIDWKTCVRGRRKVFFHPRSLAFSIIDRIAHTNFPHQQRKGFSFDFWVSCSSLTSEASQQHENFAHKGVCCGSCWLRIDWAAFVVEIWGEIIVFSIQQLHKWSFLMAEGSHDNIA